MSTSAPGSSSLSSESAYIRIDPDVLLPDRPPVLDLYQCVDDGFRRRWDGTRNLPLPELNRIASESADVFVHHDDWARDVDGAQLRDWLSSEFLAVESKARCLYAFAHAAVELAYSDHQQPASRSLMDSATTAISRYAGSTRMTIALMVRAMRRDSSIATHATNVAFYAAALAARLRYAPDDLPDLVEAALYHDIGKTQVDPSLLDKPSILTTSEWILLKKHSALGVAMMADQFRDRPAVLRLIQQHHERLDGSGYPNGLVGRAIPPGARIIALADAYDAMTTSRPYQAAKPAFSVLQELATVHRGKFDQSLFEPFIRMLADQGR